VHLKWCLYSRHFQIVYALTRVRHTSWYRRKEVESATVIGLCCTHKALVSALSSGFPISQGNAETLDRRGGKAKYRLISYFLTNTSAKNYRNRIVYIKIIVSQRWDVFETQCSLLCVCLWRLTEIDELWQQLSRREVVKRIQNLVLDRRDLPVRHHPDWWTLAQRVPWDPQKVKGVKKL